MIERLPFLWPEIVLFITTCVVMVLGLSRTASLRQMTAWIAGLGIAASGVVAAMTTPHGDVSAKAGQILLPNLPVYGKVIVAVVGVLLLLLMGGTMLFSGGGSTSEVASVDSTPRVSAAECEWPAATETTWCM